MHHTPQLHITMHHQIHKKTNWNFFCSGRTTSTMSVTVAHPQHHLLHVIIVRCINCNNDCNCDGILNVTDGCGNAVVFERNDCRVGMLLELCMIFKNKLAWNTIIPHCSNGCHFEFATWQERTDHIWTYSHLPGWSPFPNNQNRALHWLFHHNLGNAAVEIVLFRVQNNNIGFKLNHLIYLNNLVYGRHSPNWIEIVNVIQNIQQSIQNYSYSMKLSPSPWWVLRKMPQQFMALTLTALLVSLLHNSLHSHHKTSNPIIALSS